VAGKRPSDPIQSASWLAEILNQLRLVWSLWKDPRVPFGVKLIPPATLIYLLWPVDLLPDVLVGLGQLDDLAVVLLGLRMFVALSPKDLVRQHLDRLAGRWQVTSTPPQAKSGGTEIVEGEYRVVDKP
jgi:uncharacterized membrane protein YkvA (DUF1232 family)